MTVASGESTRSAATFGTFDGVHVGHQLLVATTRALADEKGLRDVVATFDRHPFATIRPEATPKLLTTQEQKIELLGSLGVDEVVVLEFDRARSLQEPEAFIEEFLVGELRVAVFVVGAGFRFGHRARGDATMLQEMGEKLGFSVVTLALVGDETGGVVSSSHVRELISDGRLGEAAHLLGRPFEVRGAILPGDGGRVVVARELLVPPPGSYQVELVSAARVFEATATVVATPADEEAIVELGVAPAAVAASGPVALRFPAEAQDPLIGAETDG